MSPFRYRVKHVGTKLELSPCHQFGDTGEMQMDHPNNLRKVMERAEKGVSWLADQIGEHRQNVTRWAKGQRKLTVPMAKKIAPLLNSTAGELLQVDIPVPRRTVKKARTDGIEIPLISWVSAGKLTRQDGVRPTDIEKYVLADLSPKGDWIALQVVGDSMDLIARDGAVIFVDRKDDRLRDNGFYVFSLDDGSTTFKRYLVGDLPRLQPYSRNPDHETIPATDDMRIIGRVKRTLLDL